MALRDFLGICICRNQSGKAGPIVRDQMFYGLAWVLGSTNFDDFGMQILWTNSYEVHIKGFQFYYLLRTKSSIFRTILSGEKPVPTISSKLPRPEIQSLVPKYCLERNISSYGNSKYFMI